MSHDRIQHVMNKKVYDQALMTMYDTYLQEDNVTKVTTKDHNSRIATKDKG